MADEQRSVQWWVIGTLPYEERAGRWQALADEWARIDDAFYVAQIPLRQFVQRLFSKQHTFAAGWRSEHHRLRSRVLLGSYVPSITRLWRIPGLWRANEALVARSLRKSLQREKKDDVTQVIVNFDWKLSWAVRGAGADFVVYDCSDLFRAYPGESPARVDWSESRTASFSDLVVVSSECFVARFRAIARDILFIPNGTSFGADDVIEKTAASASARPIVGYHGAADNWRFDWDFMFETARLCPELDFHVITGSPSPKRIPVSNVRRFGWIRRDEIGQRIQTFAAGFMPYRLTEPTLSVFPTKLFEYFAYGLPVVSTRLRELQRFGGAVDLVSNPGEAAACLKAAVGSADPELRRQRIDVARTFSWENLALKYRQAILTRLEESDRVSHA